MSLITETEYTSLHAAVSDAAPRCDRLAVVDASAKVGRGSVVGPHVVVDALAVIGEHCVIESGAHVCRGTLIEDGVHIGAHVAFASAPGAAQVPAVVKQGAWIGANASIVAGVVIGAKAVVRPGTVVMRSVPPGAIVEGNPANIVGYVDTVQGPASAMQVASSRKGSAIEATGVKGVTVHHFPVVPDLRGSLTVGEFDRQIPFMPKRYFMVFGVPNREIRGEHAHHQCHQFLICIRGSCAVVADDGEHKVEVTLDSPDRGIYLPPMTWGIQYKYSADALLLVFASDYYDSADYIRDYGDFIRISAAVN
ncbi:WxcM-like domain-containing protein [Sphaerotilaceae bacterium SBD11-9]